MSKDKLSAQDIVDELAAQASVNKKNAEDFLRVFISTLEETLIGEEPVKVKNFGTFKVLWIEPRKSVNVKTGEEIVLNGYYKIDFTPDNVLKERVNEPFAHLEPVVLDGNALQQEKPDTEAEMQMDPLKTLNEQADEIKSLLSEIQSLKPKIKSEKKPAGTGLVVEKPIVSEQFESEVSTVLEASKMQMDVETNAVKDELVETDTVPVPPGIDANHDDFSKEEELIEEIEAEIEPVVIPHVMTSQNELEQRDTDSGYEPNRFLEGVEPLKTPKGWLWLAMLLVILIVVVVLGYFNLPQVNNWVNENVFGTSVTAQPPKPVASKAVKPALVVVPVQKKDTAQQKDSVKTVARKDIVQDVFSQPRSYTEFVAAERLFAGNRLAHIAKKYFGHSDFWVYLYEANKQRISNPDRIPENTLIQIPKLDKRLIDPKNPLCIQKARELGNKYLKK